MADQGNAIRFNMDGVYHIDAWAHSEAYEAQPGDHLRITIESLGVIDVGIANEVGQWLSVNVSATAPFAEGETVMVYAYSNSDIRFKMYAAAFYVGPWTPPSCI